MKGKYEELLLFSSLKSQVSTREIFSARERTRQKICGKLPGKDGGVWVQVCEWKLYGALESTEVVDIMDARWSWS